MQDGESVTKHKNDDGFVKEIKKIDKNLIKTVTEVNWAELKKNIDNIDGGVVVYKETGDIIESLSTRETLPSIEIKTE